jgi:hypothetical protein
MNTKTTATEYLFEKLWETPKDKLTWNAILEQAKEMEKGQIIDVYNYWDFAELGEQYYKETYGK